MKTGRPTAWNPFSSLSSLAWSEVVQLASKDRLSVPISIRRLVPWTERLQPSGGVLAVIDPNGSAELKPWTPHGDDIVSAVKTAIAHAEADQLGDLVLAAMDSYIRLTLDQDGRTVLPSNLVAHVDPSGLGRVRVLALRGRMWLWSEIHWQRGQSERIALLAGALGARPAN